MEIAKGKRDAAAGKTLVTGGSPDRKELLQEALRMNHNKRTVFGLTTAKPSFALRYNALAST